MANFTDLITTVDGMFDVLDVIIENVTTLLTGNLMVLALVGGMISLILGLIASVYLLVTRFFNKSTGTMKG